MKMCKLLLAVMGAGVLLGALTLSASARNFSVTSQTLRTSYREVRFTEAFGEVNCQVTLEGSLHGRTMAKTMGSLMGYITSATLGPCSTGAATIDRETLPWHRSYEGFEGTLPNITSIVTHIINFSFRRREPLGMICHIRTTVAEPMHEIFHRTNGRLTESGLSGRIRTTPPCNQASLTIIGASEPVPGTAISVTLI
jgi:hypothetical protein